MDKDDAYDLLTDNQIREVLYDLQLEKRFNQQELADEIGYVRVYFAKLLSPKKPLPIRAKKRLLWYIKKQKSLKLQNQ